MNMAGKDQNKTRHDEEIRRLVEGVLGGEGETYPALRRAVEHRAGALSGRGNTMQGEVPEILQVYVDKIALHAYKVTDEDIKALQQAGYSEDAIFEITLSAALGAGMARLERGHEALKGDKQ